MKNVLKILLVEDVDVDAELIERELSNAGLVFESYRVQNRKTFLMSLENHNPDLIISDYTFPAFDGITALTLACTYCPDVPFIFVSGTMGEETAVDTLKQGARDYVLKDRLYRLVPAVKRALAEVKERKILENERANLEEHRLRMNKLIAVSIMSAGVVHEITQPLNAIKVIADGMLLLMENGQDFEPTELAENLHAISDQVKKTEDIIRHIRSYASLNSHSESDCCDLNHSLNQALFILRRQFSSHGISLHLDLQNDLPLVRGQTNQLEEVIINLLCNALHALDSVKRDGKEVICQSYCDGVYTCLSISDNAIGISDEIMPYIMEPFFTTKQTGHSMGLGLSIAHSILTRFGGDLKVSNNERGGATFQIVLPQVLSKGDVLIANKNELL